MRGVLRTACDPGLDPELISADMPFVSSPDIAPPIRAAVNGGESCPPVTNRHEWQVVAAVKGAIF